MEPKSRNKEEYDANSEEEEYEELKPFDFNNLPEHACKFL